MYTIFCTIVAICIQIHSHNSLAIQLAADINSSSKVEWSKMTDDQGNVRYTINLYEIPFRNSLELDQTLLKSHNKVESSTR